jgi:hypothetical protein
MDPNDHTLMDTAAPARAGRGKEDIERSLPDREHSPASDPTPSPDPSPVPDPKPPAGPVGPAPVPGVIPPRPAST